MIEEYNQMLQEAIDAQDTHKLMFVYVKSHEIGINLREEVSEVLLKMGKSAVEKVARMLNDKSISVKSRGTIAHLLMTVINSQPEIGNTDATKNELQQALSDVDFFVSGNSEEALIALGIKEISGVPIKKHAGNLREQKLNNDFRKLFGR
ncbi:MAG: hypothetical protein HY755_05500 [Nitrospirae bacterium]|nr:hypothetical protein [Nitrospirota bacterium]